MTKKYDQHRAAFTNVEAHVVTWKGERVGTIAFKFPKDGAGRLYAYVHIFGLEMARGYAGGFGYDKKSAAVSGAIEKIKRDETFPSYGISNETIETLQNAFKNIGGHDWKDILRNLGFQVYCDM